MYPRSGGAGYFRRGPGGDGLRVLAATSGNRHTNVLQAYDKLKCSDEFMRLNFQPHEYIGERGNTQRSVTMTKDGFTMLAMGFTGPGAMASKEAYIAVFNAMADHIANCAQSLWKEFQGLVAKESESKLRASFVALLTASERMAAGYNTWDYS